MTRIISSIGEGGAQARGNNVWTVGDESGIPPAPPIQQARQAQ